MATDGFILSMKRFWGDETSVYAENQDIVSRPVLKYGLDTYTDKALKLKKYNFIKKSQI